MLGRWRCNIVEDSLVDCEVHEVDTELTLDLCLFLNRVLDDHAHLLNSIHLSLLCHEDPILKHFVEVKRILTHALELV